MLSICGYLNLIVQCPLSVREMSLAISAAGSCARRTVPLTAIPPTPVARIEGMSSAVIPPIAMTGIRIPSASILEMILRYPSRPSSGERFFLVVVKRKGPQPM